MSKLDKLTFYSKLQDLFESIPPHEIAQHIDEAIDFIQCNLEWYEMESHRGTEEMREGMEALIAINEAFEEAKLPTEAWSFYLYNHKYKYHVNIRTFYNFLNDYDDFVGKLEGLSGSWHVLIRFDNIQQFQKVQTIISNLKYTFGESVYSSW